MAAGTPRGDGELIAAVRSGGTDAYDLLYSRHRDAALVLARQLARAPADADDIVADAFTRVLGVLRRGGGPDELFRPYLLTAVRHTAYDHARGQRAEAATEQHELPDPGEPFADPAVASLERSLAARAFRSLPERWRAVLWYTEVEQGRPAEVAPLLGLTPNGLAALAYRAREGLRRAYLQMHLQSVPREECRPVTEKLGGYVRGGLSRRDAGLVREHLGGCAACRSAHAELTDVNATLRGSLAPVILGGAAAGYLSGLAAAGSRAARLPHAAYLRQARRHLEPLRPGRLRQPGRRTGAAIAGCLALAAWSALAGVIAAGPARPGSPSGNAGSPVRAGPPPAALRPSALPGPDGPRGPHGPVPPVFAPAGSTGSAGGPGSPGSTAPGPAPSGSAAPGPGPAPSPSRPAPAPSSSGVCLIVGPLDVCLVL